MAQKIVQSSETLPTVQPQELPTDEVLGRLESVTHQWRDANWRVSVTLHRQAVG